MEFDLDLSAVMLNVIVLVGVLYAMAVEVGTLVFTLGRFKEAVIVVRVKRSSRWWYRLVSVLAVLLAVVLVVLNTAVVFLIALSALSVGFFFYSVWSGICLIGETGMGQSIPGRGMEIAWTEVAEYNWTEHDLRIRVHHGARKEHRFRFRNVEQIPDIKERMTRYLDRVSVGA